MKCISCQNEIPDGSINCPTCGTIQQVNNGVAVQPVQPVQPVAPAQPIPQAPGVPVQPTVPQQPGAVPQQPVAVPQPQAPVDPNSQVQALGTVSQRDAIAQGIQQGTLVNGSLTAAEVIGGKEHQNFINEEKKQNKKKLIITAIVVGILIALIIGGYIFYQKQYHSAKDRIEKIFTELGNTVSGEIKNMKVQENSGEYKLDVQIDRSNKKYGIVTEGKFAYNLTKSFDITSNISSINYGEELLDGKPINLELYINDSKAYINPQNFLDKYVYTEFEDFNKYKSNISQNNIAYNTIVKEAIKNIGVTLKGSTSQQEIATSSLTNKKANIIKYTFNSENRKSVLKRYFDSLASNASFMMQYEALTGNDENRIISDFNDYVNDIKYDPNLTYTIEFHSGIFKSEFYGMKITITGNDSTRIITIKTVSNGYKIKCVENGNQLLDLTYTKKKGKTSVANNTYYSISGSVFYDNQASNIEIKFDLTENMRVEVPDVKVKDSINIKNVTEDDINTIISKFDQYPKLKSLVITPIQEYSQSLVEQPIDNCSPDMNCISPSDVPSIEETNDQAPSTEENQTTE